ncbi:MAG: GNAT family N-acetyltransferase [Eubacteriales bacterium]|nr:GNAT family N-acetyltransferase [Eubacteriales bacterium]
MNEIEIRTMVDDDYDQVQALWMRISGFAIRSIDDSREDVLRFIRRNPTTSVVAVDPAAGGKIVGSILCGNDGRQASFYHVCVSRKYRRRGIGTKMVIFCMNALRDLQINKIALIAFTKNDAGNAFWKQIGWTHRSDCNYYEFALNEANITRYIAVNETEE